MYVHVCVCVYMYMCMFMHVYTHDLDDRYTQSMLLSDAIALYMADCFPRIHIHYACTCTLYIYMYNDIVHVHICVYTSNILYITLCKGG